MEKVSKFRTVILTIVGSFITSMGVSLFYIPANVVSGGVSGIVTILYNAFNFAPGIVYGIINGALLISAWFILGKEFVFKTLLGASCISVFVQLLSYLPPVTSDPFLASVIGAILYGVGIGIALISGSSTGGTDIAARIIQHYREDVSIGKLLLIVDATVILISLLVFRNTNLALYGIIALAISTFAVDFLISKLNISKLAFVITDKGEEISKVLVSSSKRGVTLIEAKGVYTGEGRQVLICALKSSEIPKFQKTIEKLDPSVFIIYSESQQIVGKGFSVYR